MSRWGSALLCVLCFTAMLDRARLPLYAQPEYVPLSHPVYRFLEYLATYGAIRSWSSAQLPLSRHSIQTILQTLPWDQLPAPIVTIGRRYLQEFVPPPLHRRVLIPTPSDSLSLLWESVLGNEEKFVLYFQDSTSTIAIEPLGSVEWWQQWKQQVSGQSALLVQGGFRLYGDLDRILGYYWQLTNGTLLYGDRTVALNDPVLYHNVKFRLLQSDFDFTTSHLRLQSEWFFASIGRMRRKLGAGALTGLFTDPTTPPYDAVSVGVITDAVRYTAMAAGLLANPISQPVVGVATRIPPKYYVYHRFAYRWEYGEVGFNEGVIFSDRPFELAYLVPLSFLKSLEHSLRDRDNSFLGIDVEYQPVAGLRLYGGFFLDDIIFSRIGTGYWSNKTAWNFGGTLSLATLHLAIEYSRAEPYTFTHFNYQNTPTHDSAIITANLPPNADRWMAQLEWWYGQRYPLRLSVSYQRHGQNLYDSTGQLLRNVGGDVWQSRRHQDSERVHFLDGTVVHRWTLFADLGYELRRNWNVRVQMGYQFRSGEPAVWQIRLLLRFGDF